MSDNLARDEIQRQELWERRELIDGQTVMMAPGMEDHSTVSGNIYRILANYLYRKPCRAYIEGPRVYLTERDYYVPDVCVLCDRDKIRDNRIYGAPDLVVEVLSPGTAHYDRGRKKSVYEQSGVREYWIVNPRDRTVEQYVPENGRLELRDVYVLFREDELDMIVPEEREKRETAFRCTLFPDLEISLEDIFYDLIE